MYRIESDLIGELSVPENAYYGVQTQRAINNFKISNNHLSAYPDFIKSLGYVKKAAAKTNFELGVFSEKIFKAIDQTCNEVISGEFNREFPVDMIQGGAGTSINMNANEVIANRALELMGFQKGEYKHCSPNDHVNYAQSTNDAYPTAIKIAIFLMNQKLATRLSRTVHAFKEKGKEFSDIIKMGRTQLQDAVPMTLGQEFEAFGCHLESDIKELFQNAEQLLTVNMGGTAIGTGLNAPAGFKEKCTQNLAEISGLPLSFAKNLIEASFDTGAYVSYSSTLKRTALKLSKICNDLRLLSSGPRAGLNEINLPAMQPGSSIMPGKVNPVIPEVVNQVCFRVIGNDLTVSFAAEAGQLQLNVMEPVMSFSIMESIQLLENALDTLVDKCISGITANREICQNMVKNSIGIVTALNPYIGYKNATKIAKEALKTGKSVYELVIVHQLMTKDELDKVLNPKNMLSSHNKF